MLSDAKLRVFFDRGIWIILGIWIVWFGTMASVYWWASSEGAAKLGQFGDVFGAINALFAGIGLLAVAYTLLLQIEQSRDDKAHQAEAARLSNETARLQLAHARIAAYGAMVNARLAQNQAKSSQTEAMSKLFSPHFTMGGGVTTFGLDELVRQLQDELEALNRAGLGVDRSPPTPPASIDPTDGQSDSRGGSRA